MIFQKMKAIATRWLGKGRQHKAPNTPSSLHVMKAPTGRTLDDYMEVQSRGALKVVARKPKAAISRAATQTVPRSTPLIGSERHRRKKAKAAHRRAIQSGMPRSYREKQYRKNAARAA